MTGYGAPQPQTRSGQQLPLFDLIGAGLGILSFVWGFLDWYGESGGGQTIKGYGALSGASGAIGLSILASAVAANRPARQGRQEHADSGGGGARLASCHLRTAWSARATASTPRSASSSC